MEGRFEALHRLLIGAILAHLDFLDEQIALLSAAIEEQLAPFAPAVELLCTIPGVQRRTAEVIVAEIGTDMSVFPSAKELASWAGQCPGNDQLAGRRRSGKTCKGSKWRQGQAAQVLAREGAIEAHTTARILGRVERGEQPIPVGALVVVDEAGMMGTHPLEALVAHVCERHGRVLLVGDRHQLAPLEAGGAFAAIADRTGAATLVENRRQRDPLQRQVATQLGEGRAADALALLAEHGRLTSHTDARTARAELVMRLGGGRPGHRRSRPAPGDRPRPS